MKFGHYLAEHIYTEWRFYYIDYDGLKGLLKERTAAESFFAEKDEAAFVEALEREMQKVFDFRDVKAGELTRHVQHCENVVDHLKAGNEHEIKAITEEIGRITAELSQLATFSRINYTGFMKILKKHDKHTEFMLKPMFMLRLSSKPLYLENLDNLIYRLSKLYDRIRSDDPSKSSPKLGAIDAATETQVFIRKTSKYWVHADNVTEVKCFVLKYLPVLIFPSRKRNIDLAVSSVYLDNSEMELYKGRLEKTEGAVAIRIRWYGSEEPVEVFVERKVHREDWTGEISVKARFPLKAKHVDGFLTGTFTAEDVMRKLRKDARRREEEVHDLGRLAGEIQEMILDKKLRPTLRTFYHRTAFQLPGDARVRISLDTELAMIREDGPRRAGGGWRRMDIGSGEYPFASLGPNEIVRFPHAILEVKLQTHAGQEPPKWAETLTSSHLVQEVPKFSKFIHGCAALFPKKTSLIPYWLPQMDIDIRKPGIIEGEGGSTDGTKRGLEEEEEEDEEDEEEDGISSGEASPLRRDGLGSKEASKEMPMPMTHPKERPPHMTIKMEKEEEQDEDDQENPLLGGKKHRFGGILGFLTRGVISNRVVPQAGDAEPTSGPSSQGTGTLQRQIYVPVRVEPKVFFANERTFLSWVHFSIFLGGLATALVGLGNRTARVSGLLFAGVSILFTGYALYLYQWRAGRIRRRDPGPYDDRVGPTIVVVVFMFAMIANLIFAITSNA